MSQDSTCQVKEILNLDVNVNLGIISSNELKLQKKHAKNGNKSTFEKQWKNGGEENWSFYSIKRFSLFFGFHLKFRSVFWGGRSSEGMFTLMLGKLDMWSLLVQLFQAPSAARKTKKTRKTPWQPNPPTCRTTQRFRRFSTLFV